MVVRRTDGLTRLGELPLLTFLSTPRMKATRRLRSMSVQLWLGLLELKVFRELLLGESRDDRRLSNACLRWAGSKQGFDVAGELSGPSAQTRRHPRAL